MRRVSIVALIRMLLIVITTLARVSLFLKTLGQDDANEMEIGSASSDDRRTRNTRGSSRHR
jgi:hypothetical protein